MSDQINARSFQNNMPETVKVSVEVKPGESIKAFRPRIFKNFDFTMVFHANNRELVRNKKLSDDEKSLLFSLLIYLDYDQYVKDESAMFFNVGRVAELLGWSRQRAGRVLEGLCSHSKRLLAYTKIGREKYYMLNPHFIFRGDTSSMDTAIKLFEQSAIDIAESDVL
ncbi:hypothetical protein PP175_21410 [Aneurinibacillus sp. Ricciae_BoGa-3]|uniref:hypothetical protein n=1 Tax=Aneurinibacillus sp. Ricciae_BoGa-3 TaxID=3022697 RepID=UPI00233FEB5A|nr:hypothetical protein [Aneurinibacillus sp. Ricciae_BoGa-3]WCK53850.1 hypothetical protein PP175_21410 [Aneurinibacillus sp. Ricciae_BoGa-3]